MMKGSAFQNIGLNDIYIYFLHCLISLAFSHLHLKKWSSVSFITHSVLSKFQYGFRPDRSAVTALIQTCDVWLENMDNGQLNGVVFLDIKKRS